MKSPKPDKLSTIIPRSKPDALQDQRRTPTKPWKDAVEPKQTVDHLGRAR